MSDYQLVVIGGGPGGYVAAIRASQLGLKTALVEKRSALGGTCLNVGCIPSKALLASSEHYHDAKERFSAHGINFKDLQLDLTALMKRKDDVVAKNVKGLDFLMKKNKIDRLTGTGRLVNATTVEIDDNGKKTKITTDHAILATGSAPVELPFLKFDGKRVISSDQGIALEKVPKSLIVIGGGAIGLELGSVWSRLGSKVTVIEFLPRIAAGADGAVADHLKKSLAKQGLEILINTKVQAAEVTTKGVTVHTLSGGTEGKHEAEIVLVAVGRRPYTNGLGLENAGLKLSEKGRIPVNSHGQTAVPNIYAIGDVVDGPMLAHKAEDEGVAVAEHIAGKPGHVNYSAIPSIIYTSPETAGVGLTEEQCKEHGTTYSVGTASFQANGRALAADATDGFVKIIADAKTDRVLGVHIVASNASELIAAAGVLIEFGGAADDLARTCFAHPTMSEAIREAAMAVNKRAIHS
jgi:dihydrolipoamide dehydrogenase